MTVDHRPFEFELDDGHSLVHLGRERHCFRAVERAVVVDLRAEHFAGIVAVGVHGERGKRQQVDAITLFESGQFAVTQRDAEHVGDVAVVAGAGSHPEHVVVSPGDVEILISGQSLHDQMRTGAAVVDVAEDVEEVDAETLDHVADGDYKLARLSAGYDGLHDARVIHLLALSRGGFVEKFLDDVGEFLRQGLAHLRARIFGADALEHAHEAV